MADYCVIVNNKVVDLIVCDSKELAEQVTRTTCVEAPWGVQIGWSYVNGAFIAPPPAPSQPDIPPTLNTTSKDSAKE